VTSPFEPELDFARRFAGQAGEPVRRILARGYRVDTKADGSVVTTVDRAVNDRFIDEVRSRFPGDGVLGEEASHHTGSERTWVVDPVDGTRQLMLAIPVYMFSAALVVDGCPVVAVTCNPSTREIDHVPWLLDPRSADATAGHDFLGWLGSWIGMTGTERLPTERHRRLVDAAAEHYRLRRWAVLDHGRLGDATRLFGPDIVRRLQLDDYARIGSFQLVDTPSPRTYPFAVYAHRFTLFVHARAGDDADQLGATAARVVAAVQPAHCVSSVAVVLPRMPVSGQASLGLDSVVAGPTPPTQLGGQRPGAGLAIGRDPRRGDRPALGIDARVGTRAAIA
jgi:hypothetical protein